MGPATRERFLAQHPGAYVIVDNHVRGWGMPTSFLESDDRRKVDAWGSTTVYQHQG